MESIEDQMLYVSFNQDYSAFVVGTERGFRIYNSYPFKDYYERILDGGIGIVEMLYKSNILALVGGGKYPKHSRNKIIIWDDYQSKVIAELSFTSYIKNVKLKKEKIFIVCDTKIYLFNLLTLHNIDTVDTFENLRGIISITYDPIINLLAYPNKANGYVKIKNYDKNVTVLTNAHENKISCLTISQDGLFLATASEKGRNIRIFRIEDGSFLEEYPIDKSDTIIYSITFDKHVQFFSCTNSSGTITIFSLSSSYKKMKENLKNERAARKSSLDEKVDEIVSIRKPKSMWDSFNPFSYESPWALFRIPDFKSISAFCDDNKILVISSEGRYYLASFNPIEPGDCIKIEEINMKISPS